MTTHKAIGPDAARGLLRLTMPHRTLWRTHDVHPDPANPFGIDGRDIPVQRAADAHTAAHPGARGGVDHRTHSACTGRSGGEGARNPGAHGHRGGGQGRQSGRLHQDGRGVRPHQPHLLQQGLYGRLRAPAHPSERYPAGHRPGSHPGHGGQIHHGAAGGDAKADIDVAQAGAAAVRE